MKENIKENIGFSLLYIFPIICIVILGGWGMKMSQTEEYKKNVAIEKEKMEQQDSINRFIGDLPVNARMITYYGHEYITLHNSWGTITSMTHSETCKYCK